MDKIHVRGITCQAHVGVTPEERATQQTIRIDVGLFLDLEAASNTDDLQLSVDYAKVVEKVAAVVEGKPVRLIETIASRVCRMLLETPHVCSVEVTVRKFPESLRDRVEYVEVEMTRSTEH